MTWMFARPADKKRALHPNLASGEAKAGGALYFRQSAPKTSHAKNIRLSSPVLMAMFLSALYGGYYGAVTGASWQDVAASAYWSATFQLDHVGEFLAKVVGLDNLTVIGPIGDIFAMVLAGLFAFCVGIGGAVVQAYSMLAGA